MLTIMDFAKTILHFILAIINALNTLGLNIPMGDLEAAYSQLDSVNLKDEIKDAVGGLSGQQ